MNVFEQAATIQSWDDDYYHPIAERFYDHAISDMLRLLEAPKGETILDAGCGPGVHSIRAARAGYNVAAIDISSSMLQEAKERVAKARVAGQVSFEQSDITRLSLSTASIKFAFSWGVIIHIRNVEGALDELARIMAPKGRLALYVTNKSAFDHKLESAARWALRKPLSERQCLKLGTGTWYTMHGERLWVWQFDVPELVRQMEARGLKLLQRRAGEFSEIQRRVTPFMRVPLLHLNNFYYRAALSPVAAAANLLLFEKC